jgi:Uma2 family endonuclease
MASAAVRIKKTRELTEAADGRCLRLNDVDWKTYSSLLFAFAERPAVRLTYDHGELEIMSPLLKHEDSGRFLGDVVYVLTDELNLPLKRGGSTTLRRRLKQRGIEADECFWIANALKLIGRRRLDLRRDPPPDLALEVDVTSSSLNRMGIYAALRVPELWRLEAKQLIFYRLGEDGTYIRCTHSVAFPGISSADLMRFLKKTRRADENQVLREFRQWLRKRILSGKNKAES